MSWLVENSVDFSTGHPLNWEEMSLALLVARRDTCTAFEWVGRPVVHHAVAWAGGKDMGIHARALMCWSVRMLALMVCKAISKLYHTDSALAGQ